MLRDIQNTSRYCNALESPPASKNKKFTFEKKTVDHEIDDFNTMILCKHNSNASRYQLSNDVYHLYEDGTITQQRGGIDYLAKTEYIVKTKIHNMENVTFRFPMQSSEFGMSYAVLNEYDANIGRAQMRDILMRNTSSPRN